jgi:hypothetical protein
MPQRVSARSSLTRKRSAGSSRESARNGSFLSQATAESEKNESEMQNLSLKLNSESIQSVTVGDEVFEMLMLDGCGHLSCPYLAASP